MTPKVQIIADDLTGALDVAGPFAARGHSTFVVVKDEGCAPDQFAGAAVLSINSASRHLAADAAAARVRSIVERLCTPAGEICIKKIDSTAARERRSGDARDAMHALGRANAIVVPAFPAQGRTVAGGMVHVDGVPLPQTGFARDALSPPPLAPLDQVFRSAAHQAQVERVAPDGPFELARPGEAHAGLRGGQRNASGPGAHGAGSEWPAGSLRPGRFGGHRRCASPRRVCRRPPRRSGRARAGRSS